MPSTRRRRLDPTKLFRRYQNSGDGAAGGGSGVDRNKIDELTGNKPVDVNAKVRVGDKEMTVGDLIASHQTSTKTAADLTARAQEIKDLEADMAKVLRANPTAKQSDLEPTYRKLLLRSGASPEEVEDLVGKAWPSSADDDDDDADDDGDVGDADPKKGAGAKGKSDSRVDTLAELAQQQLDMARSEAVTGAMQTSPELKRFLDGMANLARLDPDAKEEDVAARVKVWREKIEQATAAHLEAKIRMKKAQTGKAFDLAWNKPLAVEALNDALGAARSMIGDPHKLGNSASVADTDPLIKYTRSNKPVARPTVDSSKSPASYEKDVEKFMGDRIKRAFAAAAEKKLQPGKTHA